MNNEITLGDIVNEICGTKCKWMELALDKYENNDEAMDYLLDNFCKDCILDKAENKAFEEASK